MTLARRARRAARLSQERFAELLGIHRVTLSRWETGSVPPKAPADRLLRIVILAPGPVLDLLEREEAQ